MKKIIYIFSILILFSNTASSQNIIRRGYIGARVSELNDSIRSANEITIKAGILVTEVMPESSAKALDIKAGDIIIKINGELIKDVKHYREMTKTLRSGQEIAINILRNLSETPLNTKLLPMPLETADNQEIIYDEVKYKDGYIRMITNKPPGKGKFKSIFFIPGYTCVSLDNLGKHPYGQLIKGLCDKGYVVMRSEKPGMGDNLNTSDCDKIDYNTEVEAFQTAYKKFLTYDFVDKENVYIFGHSLGGYEAPMVAEREGAKGVIVCGTGILTWFEYIVEMFRFQNIIQGADYVDNEVMIQKIIPVLYDYLIKKKTPKEIAADSASKKLLEEYLEYNGGNQVWSRHYSYWQQLQDLNMPEIWKNISGKVLIIRGEADFEAFSTEEHQLLEDIVNKYHPGNGKFMLIPDMDHGFAKSKTPAESFVNRQKKGYYYDYFNPVIIDTVDYWISGTIKN